MRRKPIEARGLDIGDKIVCDSFKDQEAIARVLRARGFSLKYHTHPMDGQYKIEICGTPYKKETEDGKDNNEQSEERVLPLP